MYFCVVVCIVCFLLFSVLFVCICVLYYCHRVDTQLQLNISYHIISYFCLFYVFLCCSMYFCVVVCIVCFVLFSVLFVCICVLYYYHRVATQLQLTNISYHKTRIRFQVSSREICGIPSGTEKGFSPSNLLFPLSAPSHQCAILIFIYMLLLRGQMDETWEL
jgi:hypothetical protein